MCVPHRQWRMSQVRRAAKPDEWRAMSDVCAARRGRGMILAYITRHSMTVIYINVYGRPYSVGGHTHATSYILLHNMTK